jgi:hypothetical protein
MTQLKRPTVSLELIEIATPCPQSWESMHGDDRVRFCDRCKLHVYDISAMSRREASELIASRQGRLCVQMYRRADGTVITDDCSAIRRAGRRVKRSTARVASALLCVAPCFMPVAFIQRCVAPVIEWLAQERTRGEVSYQVAGGIRAPSTQPVMGKPVMGDVALPTTQPATQEK